MKEAKKNVGNLLSYTLTENFIRHTTVVLEIMDHQTKTLVKNI